ncbi:MAG: KR domain-containing protein [Sandaracinaceae bacterium]|nr:KR domain-containing protein [Sandaracinaceae bacterium]
MERDIAIVGMAARVPGAQTPAELWKNLVGGVESIRQYTDEELLQKGERPELLRDPRYVRAAAPLAGLPNFDGEFFGFSPKDCAIMDPQHRHFLECAWEALENAAHPPERFGGPVGVFAGCGMGSYFYVNVCSQAELVRDVGLFLLRHTGNDKDFLSTRVSYLLDLAGPAINVQTACSTSLVATHLAVQSLLARECDMALAGGVTIELPHERGYLYHEGEVLSPDGHCHAFDHRGQGTVFGSGVGVVVLRRLGDALDDGDVIHAVIRGTAVNNDGAKKVNYLAPSVDGQAACVVEALGVAGVPARSVEYIECHGTGTALGDPIEVEALTQGFRTQTEERGFCQLGSIKTNIGHLDTAAGVIGLIKATLALKHAQIPPSLGYEKPNPAIDFESSPFRVASQLSAWPAPAQHPRRAAVNSLGVGGTNAHVVLQEPPGLPEPEPPKRTTQLITLSARTRSSLDAQSQRLAAHLLDHAQRQEAGDGADEPSELSLADVAFTLHHGRRAFGERRVLAASSLREAAELLQAGDPQRVFTHTALRGTTESGAPHVAFLLPGGGAQYARMTAGLFEHEPVFREHMERGLELLRTRHQLDLAPLLYPAAGDEARAQSELDARMDRQLPAIFLTSVAMARTFEHYGVTASAYLGHSAGENTAAHLSGVMSLEDCLGLVMLRAQLFMQTEPGAMLSVTLPEAELRALLPDTLELAVVNGPEACVVSGEPGAIAALEASLAAREDVETQRLAIPVAAHSRLLDPILERFGAYLRSITLSPPRVSFLSNRSGTWITDAEATDPAYWVSHLRSAVRFADNVDALLQRGPSVLLEVGPGRTLSSLARQHGAFRSGGHQAFASVRHKDEAVSDAHYLTACLGRLWATGAELDWGQLWPGELRSRVELPTYAWDHKPYFIEPAAPARVAEESALEKLPDVRDWGFVPRFKPSLVDLPLADDGLLDEGSTGAGAEGAQQTHLIFMDRGGVGQRLRARLQAAGQRVVAVYEGDAFHYRGDDEYTLSPERGREGYASLIQDLVERGRTPERVAHLWLLELSEEFRPGSSLFHHHLERGFFSLFFLAKALIDASLPGVHLSVVGNGLLRVGADEAPPHPQKSTVLGPVKVLSRELEGATARLIDVTLPTQRAQLFGGSLRAGLLDPFGGKRRVEQALDTLSERLFDELRATAGDEVVALRGDKRLTQVFVPRALAPVGDAPKPSAAAASATKNGAGSAAHAESPAAALTPETLPAALRERGVYLITGGLGGLGLTVSQYLARTCHARLALLGRTPLPPREQWDTWIAQHGADERSSRRMQRVLELEAAGAEVLLLTGDVTNADEVRAALAAVDQRFSALHGVFHAAGELDDDLIALKTLESVEHVFAPKIQGTRILHELTRERGLDFLLLFSSTSTATAPAGQVDYVAANAFLDAFAESERAQGHPVTSLHWGIWSDVGMAAEPARVRAHAPVGTPIGQQPTHPWLSARVSDGRGESTLRGTLAPARHWLLDGHRTLGGRALVPGTGFVELARAALRAYGEEGPFEIEDLFFVRPFAVADGEARDLHVKLRPSERGYRFEVRGQVHVGGREGTVLVAQAHLALRPEPPRAALDTAALQALQARCDRAHQGPDSAGLRTPQEAHLRFGPRWRVLHEAHLGATEGLARLALPPAFAGEVAELGLHPALLDIATGWAMPLIEGYGAEALYVPVAYERARVYADLTPQLLSWVRTPVPNHADAEFAFFDVTLMDPSGRVLMEVERLGLRRMTPGPDFAQGERVAPADVAFDEEHGAQAPSPGELQRDRLLARGIGTTEGQDALGRVLQLLGLGGSSDAARKAPAQIFVSSMDLPTLVRESGVSAGGETAGGGLELARPDLGVDYLAPRDEVEKTLVGFWQELLGVDQVGVQDSFFDLGGHSLLAVRLFAKIKAAYRVEFPISVLFEAPTIERCALLVKERLAERGVSADGAASEGGSGKAAHAPRYTHLVPMHTGDGGPKTPFFLVAGMFGNVLNLRHLAHLVGTDRRFYGLQARGLYGEQAPHETFEEMAAAYIEELKSVQPRGPYFLGGFSGGGITAYEIARQLEAQGDEVALLVMLDTPVPMPPADLSVRDRVLIQRAELRAKGPAYVAEWVERRAAWELGKLRRRFESATPDSTPEKFHDEAIEQAFRRALERYEVRARPAAELHLFRPVLPVAYDLGNGRRINHERSYVYEDNGWSPYVRAVHVSEVPGDHDSMVLEPNVRVLARQLRAVVEAAENQLRRAR